MPRHDYMSSEFKVFTPEGLEDISSYPEYKEDDELFIQNSSSVDHDDTKAQCEDSKTIQ